MKIARISEKCEIWESEAGHCDMPAEYRVVDQDGKIWNVCQFHVGDASKK